MEWGFCNMEREWMKLKMSLNCRVSAPNTEMVNMCVGLSLSFARTHAVAIHFQCNVRTQTHTLSNRFYLSNSNGVQKQNAIYIERYFARLDLYFFSTNNCLLYHNNAKYYLIRRLFQWLAWQNEHIIPLPCVHFILCIRFCVFICEKSVLHTCININYGMVNK